MTDGGEKETPTPVVSAPQGAQLLQDHQAAHGPAEGEEEAAGAQLAAVPQRAGLRLGRAPGLQQLLQVQRGGWHESYGERPPYACRPAARTQTPGGTSLFVCLGGGGWWSWWVQEEEVVVVRLCRKTRRLRGVVVRGVTCGTCAFPGGCDCKSWSVTSGGVGSHKEDQLFGFMISHRD